MISANAAEELDGRPATELLIGEAEEGCVFESRVAVDDREIWLRHADGTAACMRVSATPVFDQNGEWLATRGVCRDITEAKMRDSALARAREREALIRGLVDTIRRVISPEEAYGAAVEQVAASTQADYAAIIRCDLAGSWRIVAEVRAAAVSLLDDAFLETEIEPDEEAMSLTVADDWKQVAVPCRYREELKGWLCIVRQAPLGAEDHTAELLATVAGLAMDEQTTKVVAFLRQHFGSGDDAMWTAAKYDDEFNKIPELHHLTTTSFMVQIITKILQSRSKFGFLWSKSQSLPLTC